MHHPFSFESPEHRTSFVDGRHTESDEQSLYPDDTLIYSIRYVSRIVSVAVFYQ